MTPKESNPNNTGRSPEFNEGRSPVWTAAALPTPEGLNNFIFNPFRVVSLVFLTPDSVGGYWYSIPLGLSGIITNVPTNKN